MFGLINIIDAISYAASVFDYALTYLFSLIGYLPGIIGSAVIIFVAVYILRFVLMK